MFWSSQLVSVLCFFMTTLFLSIVNSSFQIAFFFSHRISQFVVSILDFLPLSFSLLSNEYCTTFIFSNESQLKLTYISILAFIWFSTLQLLKQRPEPQTNSFWDSSSVTKCKMCTSAANVSWYACTSFPNLESVLLGKGRQYHWRAVCYLAKIQAHLHHVMQTFQEILGSYCRSFGESQKLDLYKFECLCIFHYWHRAHNARWYIWSQSIQVGRAGEGCPEQPKRRPYLFNVCAGRNQRLQSKIWLSFGRCYASSRSQGEHCISRYIKSSISTDLYMTSW